jgi:hypothetical protein
VADLLQRGYVIEHHEKDIARFADESKNGADADGAGRQIEVVDDHQPVTINIRENHNGAEQPE